MANARLGILGGLLLTLTGCGSAPDVEVVDLNKVLDAVAAVLDEGAAPAAAPAGDAEGAPIEVVDAEKEDAAKEKEFLTKLAAKLNEMHMIKSTIGVQLNSEGAIEGFRDPNANMSMEDGEDRLFLVEIDAERSRLIASDTYSNHRDHHYRFRPGGLFMGYMLGSMLGRQNTHFAATGATNDFANRQMSPKNYHAGAVASAKASAPRVRSTGSARSTSGSRGFSFGK
jgi:hypothetical protein